MIGWEAASGCRSVGVLRLISCPAACRIQHQRRMIYWLLPFSLLLFILVSLFSCGIIQCDKGKLSSPCGLFDPLRVKTSEITLAQLHCLAKHQRTSATWVCVNTLLVLQPSELKESETGIKTERERSNNWATHIYNFHKNTKAAAACRDSPFPRDCK